EYYGHSSINEGSPLKAEALSLCASIDEEDPQYKTLISPLIKRVAAFFSHSIIESDFADEVRMLRAHRLIEEGKYQAAHKVYHRIAYGPLYAQAFEEQNRYFLDAAKGHLHIFKQMSDPHQTKHHLLAALVALAYVQAYPHGDDVTLYQNAKAIFAQNHYYDASMIMLKICHEQLPQYLSMMNQHELLMTYQALVPYKYALSHDVTELNRLPALNNRLERWNAMGQWFVLVKMLQQNFVARLFSARGFNYPEPAELSSAHALLDEPTSKVEKIKHLLGSTPLEKNFRLALTGDVGAMRNLQGYVG
ncbi:MAG TPA: hypothetical protein VI522_04610, partial [Gammaproteobacteria bacterium]|nr:hypothetical protein [Gammaproteobacteria bacterium]